MFSFILVLENNCDCSPHKSALSCLCCIFCVLSWTLMSLPFSRGVCSQFVSYLVQLVSLVCVCVCVCIYTYTLTDHFIRDTCLIANQPITWLQLNPFRHLDVVKTTSRYIYTQSPSVSLVRCKLLKVMVVCLPVIVVLLLVFHEMPSHRSLPLPVFPSFSTTLQFLTGMSLWLVHLWAYI